MRTITHIVLPASLLLIAAALGVALSTQPARAQTPAPAPERPLALPDYIAQLRIASDTLAGSGAGTIHAVRAALPSEWVVELNGQTLRVKTDWLASALAIAEAAPPDAAKLIEPARQRLAALREAAEALAASPAAVPDAARARLDRILNDREFQGVRGPSWLDRQKARLYAWISRRLEKLFGSVGISAATGNAIAWTLVVLVTLLLTFWAVRYWISGALRSNMDLRGAAPAGRDWRHWVAEAQAAAARGDYRVAIHATYWAGVARIEESSLLPEDRSRTPRESLRLVQPGSAAYEPLAHLTRRFERTWYGYHAATSADWDDAMRQLETLGCLRSSTPAIAAS